MNNVSRVRIIRTAVFAVAVGLLATSCSRQARVRRLISRADAHFTSTQYDVAEIEYKNALQLVPLDAHAIGRLGMIYRAEGRTGPALAYLGKAKELQPNDVDVRLNLGLAYASAGAPQLARQEALFVVEQRPDDPDAPLLLAEASQTAGNQASAVRRLNALAPKNRSAVLVALGQLALRGGNVTEGQRLFEQAVAADPKSPTAAAALGMLYWARKDTMRAEELLKRAAETSPIRSPRRIQYAQFKLQTGDAETAKRLGAVISQQAPDYLPAWKWRIEIAASEKKYDDALEMLREALARDSTDAELLLLSARVRLAKGDIDQGITELERIVTLYPRLPAGVYLLGSAYMAKGNVGKAAEAMARATALVPNYTPAVMALAELNVRRGNYTTAITALKPLIAKNPQLVAARLLLAQAYRDTGDLDAAAALYQGLEKDAADNPQVPYLRGVVLRQLGRPDAARTAFERALQLNPAAIQPIQNLVEMDMADKAFDRARQRAELAVARSPKAVEPYLMIAAIGVAQNNLTEAQVALQRAIAVQPAAPGPYLMLAKVYVAANEQAKALAKVQELTAKDPRNADALTMTAVLYDAMKRPDEARATYERVLSVDPNSVVALNNLSYLLAEKPGQVQKAYEYAQRARALLPDDPRTADTLGWILYLKAEYLQALPLLRESALKLPDAAGAQYHLGMTCYMLGDEDAARAALRMAVASAETFGEREAAKQKMAVLAIDSATATPDDRVFLERIASQRPSDPVALTRLSALCMRAEDLPNARRWAEAAVQASSHNGRAVAQLARVLAAQGDRAHALEYARDAHTAAPDDAAVTSVLGRIAFGAGQYRWAASLLEEAAGRLPGDADVQFDWAKAAYSVGRVSDAEAVAQHALDIAPSFARAAEATRLLKLIRIAANPVETDTSFVDDCLKQDPNDVPSLIARSALHEERGDWKSAQTGYERAIQTCPDFGPAQKSLTLLYAAHPADPVKTAAVALKAREAFPSDPAVAKALGIIAYRQTDYSRAATLLQESATTFQADGEILYYLGMSQHQLKRTKQARETLQRAISLGLRSDLVREARRVVSEQN